MKVDFRLTAGNLPLLQDILTDDTNTAADLNDVTLKFLFAGAGVSFAETAEVVSVAEGTVKYQFKALETAKPGLYEAQWQVTPNGDGTSPRTYPTASLDNDDVNGRYLRFEIVPEVAVDTPENIVSLRQLHVPVRAILGDMNDSFQKYQATAIDNVLRTCLMVGKVPGHKLTPDRMGISPGLTVPQEVALLTYHAAKMFVAPNVAEFSYKTRAMSERFGKQDHFLFELNNAIYDLENPAMFYSFQSFYSWVNSLTGVDVWSLMSDMKVSAPVATIAIGRAGVVVNTI